MLKGIDPRIHADLMHAMMQMGHGDDLVICDVNHPACTIAAHTTYGRLLDISGCGLPEAARAILTLFPLDTFVESPVRRMQVVGNPDGRVPIFDSMQAVLDQSAGHPVSVEALERFAFYEAAKKAFVIVRTSDFGPYGCFIFKKGVIAG